MGMHLSVYVGPYFSVSKDFEWEDFDSLVYDGRGEAGHDDKELILIPNRDVPGLPREMRIEHDGEQQQSAVTSAMIESESIAFADFAKEVLDHCADNGIAVRQLWGIVPCWS